MKKILEYLTVLAVGSKILSAIFQNDPLIDRDAVNSLFEMLESTNGAIDPKTTAVNGFRRLLDLSEKR